MNFVTFSRYTVGHKRTQCAVVSSVKSMLEYIKIILINTRIRAYKQEVIRYYCRETARRSIIFFVRSDTLNQGLIALGISFDYRTSGCV